MKAKNLFEALERIDKIDLLDLIEEANETFLMGKMTATMLSFKNYLEEEDRNSLLGFLTPVEQSAIMIVIKIRLMKDGLEKVKQAVKNATDANFLFNDLKVN